MSTAHVVESSEQRWQPAAAAATALSMTASTASTASTAPSKTQRITAFISGSTSSSKNWRGKYLRALNISTPEVDVISRKKHTPIVTSGGATGSTTSTAALGTAQQRRMRSYRVDPNNRNSVTLSRSFSTSTEREGDEFQARVNRYQVSQAARYSNNSRRGGVIIKEPRSTTSTNSSSSGMGYGFAMKPDLARGRRCHTDPFVSGEGGDDKTTEKMASAPIQIPSAAANSMDFRSIGGKLSDIDGATTINKNYSSKRYGSKSPVSKNQSKSSKSNNNQDVTTGGGNLLSWEEPAVMMGGVAMNGSKPVGGGAGAGLGGLDIAFSNVQINSSNNSRSIHLNSVGGGVGGDLFCDEFVDTEDEDDRDVNGESHDDDDSDSDDDDDEIFEMEDFDSDNSMKINNSSSGDNTNKFHSSSETNNSSSISKSKFRRRRTASASQATAPPSSRRSSALPRHHSVRQMRTNGTPSSPAMELPESFVPPHQMIQRDCFSIGLRDEFKRRQAKI